MLLLGEQEPAERLVKFQGWFGVFGSFERSGWVHPWPGLLSRLQAGGARGVGGSVGTTPGAGGALLCPQGDPRENEI